MSDRNPFEEIEEFVERMTGGFEGAADWPLAGGRDVPVDVLDRGDAYEVVADLPGAGDDDVELTLGDGALRLTAEPGDGDDEEDARYVRRERRDGPVERAVPLPGPVEEDGAEATLSDGVLRVSLPKRGVGDESTTIDIE